MRPEIPLRCGVNTGIVHGLSLAEGLGLIAAAGFRSVELYIEKGHLDDWPDDPAAARRALGRAGLRAATVHTPPEAWRLDSADEDARRESLRAAAACLGPAAGVGAPVVVVHPAGAERSAASGDSARRSLSELAGRAADLGVRLAVENLRPLPVAGILKIIDGLGEHVGLCLDVGHSRAGGLNPIEEARLAGAKLFATHLHDNDGSADQHLVPGRGCIDWDGLLDALGSLGDGPRHNFEAHCLPDGPEATLRALAEVRGAWGWE